jgi:hypothetical protein
MRVISKIDQLQQHSKFAYAILFCINFFFLLINYVGSGFVQGLTHPLSEVGLVTSACRHKAHDIVLTINLILGCS